MKIYDILYLIYFLSWSGTWNHIDLIYVLIMVCCAFLQGYIFLKYDLNYLKLLIFFLMIFSFIIIMFSIFMTYFITDNMLNILFSSIAVIWIQGVSFLIYLYSFILKPIYLKIHKLFTHNKK